MMQLQSGHGFVVSFQKTQVRATFSNRKQGHNLAFQYFQHKFDSIKTINSRNINNLNPNHEEGFKNKLCQKTYFKNVLDGIDERVLG